MRPRSTSPMRSRGSMPPRLQSGRSMRPESTSGGKPSLNSKKAGLQFLFDLQPRLLGIRFAQFALPCFQFWRFRLIRPPTITTKQITNTGIKASIFGLLLIGCFSLSFRWLNHRATTDFAVGHMCANFVFPGETASFIATEIKRKTLENLADSQQVAPSIPAKKDRRKSRGPQALRQTPTSPAASAREGPAKQPLTSECPTNDNPRAPETTRCAKTPAPSRKWQRCAAAPRGAKYKASRQYPAPQARWQPAEPKPRFRAG